MALVPDVTVAVAGETEPPWLAETVTTNEAEGFDTPEIAPDPPPPPPHEASKTSVKPETTRRHDDEPITSRNA